MSNDVEIWTDFLKATLPSAIGLLEDLFKTHKGDAIEARRDIEDRRAEIALLRTERDTELEKKHHP